MSRAVKMTRLGTREKLEARLAELGLSLPIDDEIEAGGLCDGVHANQVIRDRLPGTSH